MIARHDINGAAMIQTLGRILVAALCAGMGLYLLWQFVERFDHYMIRRRRAKVRQQAGGDTVCRWGVNSTGELYCVRTLRTPKD